MSRAIPKGPIVHGALLFVALLLAYKGWTKDDTKKPDIGKVEVWKHEVAAFTGLAYESKNKSVKISYQEAGGERYLWGEHARTKAAPKPKKKDNMPAPPPEAGETVTRTFPVDVDEGEKMITNFAKLKALSDLGTLDDEKKKEYGLTDSTDNLSVSFKDGQENLIIGSRVYGGSDRYVLHAESGKAFVLAAEVLRPVEAGETTLRLKKLHSFEEIQLASVGVDSLGVKKQMVKTEITDDKGTRDAWAYAESPKKADLTLDSFLDRADKLSPSEYVSEDPKAELVVRLSYQGKSGKELGFLEFYRKVPPELAKGADNKDKEKDKEKASESDKGVPEALADPDKKSATPLEGDNPDADKEADKNKEPEKPAEIEYFIRTERTRVWGKVSRLAAERFDQDVATLFEREPPPTTPTPERKPRGPRGVPGHGGPPGMPGHGGMPGGRPGMPGGMRPGMRPGGMPRPGMPPGGKPAPGAKPGPGAKPPGVKPKPKGAKPAPKPAGAKPAPSPAPKKPAPKKPAPKKPAPKKPAPKPASP